MRAQIFVLAAVCLAAALTSPIDTQTPMDLEKMTDFDTNLEDVTGLIRFTEQTETKILTELTDSLMAMGNMLTSRVLSAYNVSQSAGDCAIAIERLTNHKFLDVRMSTRAVLAKNVDTVSNALNAAESTEEIDAAMEIFGSYQAANENLKDRFMEQAGKIYVDGLNKIMECTN